MPIDYRRMRELLKALDLRRLFVETLNWANPQTGPLLVEAAGKRHRCVPFAEQGGMVAFTVRTASGDGLPDRRTRAAIHNQVAKHAYEHLLVFLDPGQTTTVWSWLRREDGKAPRPNEHRFHIAQPGDSLLQRLENLAFSWEDLDDEGRATIVQVTDHARKAFAVNAEKVTKRFYDEFKRQHETFLKFIQGIEAIRDGEWYASVMLNRLMFVYFVQKKGFLAGDQGYLATRLGMCRMQGIPFYRGFLLPLFFDGFATRPQDRSPAICNLLGPIPYLDGGLFMPHPIEQASCPAGAEVSASTITIDIPDKAFEKLFAFFDRYNWHLDDRPLRADNEINPDVLGYTFEKYINQKQMGAYYTKEDITGYISKNTIIPFLFDTLKRCRPEALAVPPSPEPGQEGGPGGEACPIDAYIYPAMLKGVDLPLPNHIAIGLHSIPDRTHWNKAADSDFALPTETWREHIARRKRVNQIREDWAAGKIADINDFITYNLDIIRWAQDFVADTQDPWVIRAFYFEGLKMISVLDPTCGSGAFLFTALNILEPLYELCLERMEQFLRRPKSTQRPQWADDFRAELERLERHPSREYFIYKTIIVNNLFGVDIMEEAVEICKLRLFLKLIAQVQDPAQIEPLPDIDFNIRAGNTLVGYASLEHIQQAKARALDFSGAAEGIVAAARSIDTHLKRFRAMQLELGADSALFRQAKAELQAELRALEAELNEDLRAEYGAPNLADFVRTHKPFHWYIEFHDIVARGGFDVIIGNPPYVEYSKVRKEYTVRGYETETCGNLYAYVMERALTLMSPQARLSLIIPLASFATQRMSRLQRLYMRECQDLWFSSHEATSNPTIMFVGVKVQLSIVTCKRGRCRETTLWTTNYTRAFVDERPTLMDRLMFVPATFVAGRLARLALLTEAPLLHKVTQHASTLESHLDGPEGAQLWYRNMGNFFFKLAFRDEPVYLRNGVRETSATVSELTFRDPAVRDIAVAVVNSSLFYYWWVILSDCYHLTKGDILSFPLDPTAIPRDQRRQLAALCPALTDALDRAAIWQRETKRDGTTKEYKRYFVQPAKPIIDEIDRVLAEHYGFTDEELDFIINYDIKYRMGGAEEE